MDTDMLKPKKTTVIRARCDADLKKDLKRVAFLQMIDPADVLRIAVRQYVEKFEANHAIAA